MACSSRHAPALGWACATCRNGSCAPALAARSSSARHLAPTSRHLRAAPSFGNNPSQQGNRTVRYLALATDYDGTLASQDTLSKPVQQALERLRTSGRRVIMVTGRRLDDLLAVCDCARLFDLIVAENGAIVYDPASRERARLADPPQSTSCSNCARGASNRWRSGRCWWPRRRRTERRCRTRSGNWAWKRRSSATATR